MTVVDNADTPAGFHLDAWTLKRLGSELPPIILLLMLMVSGLALLIEGFAQICRLYSFDQHRTFKRLNTCEICAAVYGGRLR